MHSALLISWRRKSVMIDCGSDWAGKLDRVNPDAILITHSHPDHAGGLRAGASCPVYATAEAWGTIRAGVIPERLIVRPRSPIKVFGIQFEAFSVEHSIQAPAVGYRITAGRSCVFYVPDLVRIHSQREALAGIQLFIGDGAFMTRPILRQRGEALIGHASIRMQLEWCREEGVRRAIFSHCGSEIVAGDDRAAAAKLCTIAKEAGIDATIAYDGLCVTL